MKKSINELAQAVYQNAKTKGWYDDGAAQNIGERIALIHSEASEALEADRCDDYSSHKAFNIKPTLELQDDRDFAFTFREYAKDTFEDEIADVVIRCLDMAAFKGFDLESHILAKMRYNTLREPTHGGKKY